MPLVFLCCPFMTPEYHRLNTYCHLVCVIIDGVWIGQWIDRLYTRLVTTRNYNAIANLHNSRITTASSKLFSSLLSS
jgi:hypothetical protein